MAGDWIKIRTDLYEDQDVLQMSDILGTDDPTTVGLLVRFWSWADKQTIDGNGIKLTAPRIDTLVGRHGFAEAMRTVGWLAGENGSLKLPNFQRHNGASAKARVLEAEAKRLRREQQKQNPETSDKCPTNSPPEVRPEKSKSERRKEVQPPLFPLEGESHEEREVLPKNWEKLPDKDKTRVRVFTNSPMMKRIGKFFNRRETTKWTVAETVALLQSAPDPEEISILERYYSLPMNQGNDYRRRDLPTLLNNWVQEVDRAQTYFAATSAA
jgi:hypothetical protein